MACCGPSLLTELKDLAHQIGDGCCCDVPPPCCGGCGTEPCCIPFCDFPFAQVTMSCPPPILAPTCPQPVKPLQLPCPCPCPPTMTSDEAERSRFANFYNNYNIDYHNDGSCRPPAPPQVKRRGRSPYCEDYTLRDDCCPLPGCPTGFKPCTMKLTPPPCCHPHGVWCAQIQPCPPKPKKRGNKYEPGPCSRPCCKHWTPKEGPCLYDDPCKAHCFNHPPGMKPSGRYP